MADLLKNQKSIEGKTRKILHQIHQQQGDDPIIYGRLKDLLSTDFLQVEKDFFTGKVCLDAGCGSNFHATLGMLEMGAKTVYAFDLDESIFETAPKFLQGFKGRYELSKGNILNMNYPDNFFDFTYCAGVLHHTVDIFQGLGELARVTKVGGILYLELRGKGGIMREIGKCLRNLYASDKNFKSFIDNLNGKTFIEMAKWVEDGMKENGDSFSEIITPDLLEQIFDEDLVLTIKDRITLPIDEQTSEEELVQWLKDHNFDNIHRLSRYPRYKNARRFLSPFYKNYDHSFSKLFYGSGNLLFKARKEGC